MIAVPNTAEKDKTNILYSNKTLIGPVKINLKN